MIVFEFKIEGKQSQYDAIDEAIRTGQFLKNKCLRFWMNNQGVGRYDLNKFCAKLAKEFRFADELNSQARQSSAEKAWSAIARFYDNCKKKVSGKKGYPNFKHNNRSSQECVKCGTFVKKSLSTRTHICKCGCVLDRDESAALIIRETWVKYDGARRNLGARRFKRLGRRTLYWDWCKPISARIVNEPRIPRFLTGGVST